MCTVMTRRFSNPPLRSSELRASCRQFTTRSRASMRYETRRCRSMIKPTCTPITVVPGTPEKMIPNLRNPKLSRTQQARQLDFLRKMNLSHLEKRRPDSLLEARIQAMATAARMQFSAAEVFVADLVA